MSNSSQIAHSLESKIRTRDVISGTHVSFESLILPKPLLQGLEDAGFQKASPIQIKALPMGRCGFDLVVKSKSGTGKTLVFTVIALESIKVDKDQVQALILAPTREIAVQIQEVIQIVGKHYEGIQVQSFIGGLPLDVDKEKCKHCHIAVGTPGRVNQLLQEGCLKKKSVKLFVMDEADNLLDNNFENDINEIYNSLPDKKQIIMCSATYPDELQNFLNNYMLSPTFVSVEVDSPLLLGLKQFVRILKSAPNVVNQIKTKNDELIKILNSVPFTQCVIFSNYQTRAESTSNFLNRNGWNTTFISSAQKQSDRLNSLNNLKQFKCRIMVSTDLTARGIDSANVDLVINYDIPINAMIYLHRMGRAGRFGASGLYINLCLFGEETTRLQNILGIIGGQDITVPILDDDLDVKCDSFQNHLKSIVPKNIQEFTEQCKMEIIAMKDHNTTKNVETKSKKTKSTKRNQSKVNSSEADEKMMVEKVVKEKISNVDTATVLQQLAAGSFCMNSVENQCSNLQELLPEENNFVNLTPKKRSSNELDTISILKQLSEGTFLNEDTKRKKSNDEVYLKNKALLSIAKTFNNFKTEKSDADSMSEYLNLLKTEEMVENVKLMGNHSESPKSGIIVMENIFMLGYKSQIDKNARKWQDYLSEDEKEKLKENYAMNNTSDEFNEEIEDEYDPDYDFELEKDVEIHFTTDEVKESTQSENIPAESSVPVSNNKHESFNFNEKLVRDNISVSSYKNRYLKNYDNLRSNLWWNGLNFPSVQDFDEWFYSNWQNRMLSIRNYVQENIYVEEMCKFRKNSLAK